jgi:hypothetical protein
MESDHKHADKYIIQRRISHGASPMDKKPAALACSLNPSGIAPLDVNPEVRVSEVLFTHHTK